ncbi:Glycosyltransferase involved in cell wall bisynthesis [Desulfomicrobium norvegicum]|uniref:Glycosyltransferase involved in cell wall bisynthesis n=1 Tax=Desulfomicrobium norvegicum (strain DSM 1741 / NCIMB 8310) TaxID=52561 RepID=A0A8G2C1B5_DESNO|nr:glycosyltransferase family 1 protein [Desulfomicrobium norvegicum]SFL47113.1 Glycosyltransferase involved in cell wall bisynthesis [Desulfomicrobium norvegicum]
MHAKKINIVYDHQIFDQQKYGGISRYFCEVASRIARDNNCDVKFASPIFFNCYLKFDSDRVKGLYIPQIPKTGKLIQLINNLIAPCLVRLCSPNLVHETYYSYKSAASNSAKVIVTVHDMIHELFPESFETSDTTRFKKAAAVNRADHVICVSGNTQQDLIRLLGVDPAKTSVVHHGYELMVAPSGMRRCEEPYILYVGSRGGYKNFDRLLQGYAASPSIHKNFQLVAFGGGELTRQERSRIQELGGGRLQVRHFSGDDEVLADLYDFAHVFVYPSLYEGFGIPPLEAMSVGCPVLCSDRSSLPEVLGDAAGFFDPESVDSIANALERVLFDSSYRQGLIEKGYGRCARYSWEKCAKETLDVYRYVVGSEI